MTPGEDELLRWREISVDASALATRAADLMDAGRDVPPLSNGVLARIEGDVLARRPTRVRRVPLGLRFALLTAVVLASVATAKGAMVLWRRYVAAPPPAAAPARHHAAPRPRVEAREPVTEAMTEEMTEEMTAPVIAPEPASPKPAAAPSPPRTRRTAMAGERAPRPTLAPAATATSEAELVAAALSRLRQASDPRGALALLDEYARTYPRGVLASEALSARLEAVLAMDDRKAALALLDGRSAFAGRLGAEQLLTRAELRASVGRYPDALGDFERLLGPLAGVVPPGGLERALYGRAVSFGHLGQDDRARAALAAYQRAFPTGKHAAEVARLLKSRPTPPRP